MPDPPVVTAIFRSALRASFANAFNALCVLLTTSSVLEPLASSSRSTMMPAYPFALLTALSRMAGVMGALPLPRPYQHFVVEEQGEVC